MNCAAYPMLRPHHLWLFHHIDAAHHDPARRWAKQRDDDADRRGLTGAVGAEETEDLAFVDRERDPIDRADVAGVDLDEVGYLDEGHGDILPVSNPPPTPSEFEYIARC